MSRHVGFSMDNGEGMLNNLFSRLGFSKEPYNSVSMDKLDLAGGVFIVAYPTHKSGFFCVGSGSNTLSFHGEHIAGFRNVILSLEKNKVRHAIVEHHLFLDKNGQFICMKRLGNKSRFNSILVSVVDMEGEVVAFFGKGNLARRLFAEAKINVDTEINSERMFYEHSLLINNTSVFKEVGIEKNICRLTLPNYLEQPFKIKSEHQRDIQFYGRMIAGIKIKSFDYDLEECVEIYRLIFLLNSGRYVCFTITTSESRFIYDNNFRVANNEEEVISFFGYSHENNHLYSQANISLTDSVS